MNSEYERQKIDCNCNDCAFLVRSFENRQKHEDNHYRWQKDAFDSVRIKLLKKADEHILKGLRGDEDLKESQLKAKQLMKESKSMVFQFNKGECTLSYGYCSLKGLGNNELKPISFIPETCQLETQHCFKHRKDI